MGLRARARFKWQVPMTWVVLHSASAHGAPEIYVNLDRVLYMETFTNNREQSGLKLHFSTGEFVEVTNSRDDILELARTANS